MYGYVTPPPLPKEEMAVYNSFYCGICKSTGKSVGQKARFTTNHEITFFALLSHELTKEDTNFSVCRCLFSRHKIVVAESALMDDVVALNLILSYYKAVDGIVDGDGFKYKVFKRALRPAYEKSAQRLPQADEIVKSGYEKLRRAEKNSEKSFDKIADVFATMMSDCLQLITGTNVAKGVVYNVAKFIYLADALDDIDEDYKAKRYNVFLANLPYEGRERFIKDNYERLSFIFAATINRAIQSLGEIELTRCHNILCDIVQKGLRQKTDQLLSSKKKLPPPKI